jgi:hypothetical protein
MQKFDSGEVRVDADDLGAIIRHRTAPLYQAGAQNSQSPMDAQAGAAIWGK